MVEQILGLPLLNILLAYPLNHTTNMYFISTIQGPSSISTVSEHWYLDLVNHAKSHCHNLSSGVLEAVL